MCRLLTATTSVPRSLAEIAGEAALGGCLALAAQHRDGWGLSWLQDGVVRVAKAPRPADQDSELQRLLETVTSTGFLLHLRWATPGFGLSYADTHPYVFDGRIALGHNGALHAGTRLPQLVPPALAARREGSTDSEAFFLQVVAETEQHPLAEGLARAVEHVTDCCAPSSLNSVVLTPEQIAVVVAYDPGQAPPHPAPDGTTALDAEYYRVRCRTTDDAVVFASSGFPQPGWSEVSNGTIATVPLGTSEVRQTPVTPPLRLPARAGE
jgi:predicted glutamine amidotransferase